MPRFNFTIASNLLKEKIPSGSLENTDTYSEYRVKQGDTFYSIYCNKGSRMVSYDEFLKINSHIKNVNLIEPGDPVYFPRIEKTPTATGNTGGEDLALIKTEYKKSDGSGILIYMLKINPAIYSMEVYYGNEKGLTVEDIKKDPETVAAINGGFFAPGQDFHPIGLLRSKEKEINPVTDYWSSSGVFYITTDLLDPYGICTKESYYNSDVTEAIQSFPLLLWDGEPKKYADKEEASRSAIGVDEEGNIILAATESRIAGGLTFNEFAEALAGSGWNIKRALNLDGGTSTQMYVRGNLTLHSAGIILGEDKVSNFLIVKEI